MDAQHSMAWEELAKMYIIYMHRFYQIVVIQQ